MTKDIFPTLVTTQDGINYINETDTGYQKLNQEITQSTVSDKFKSSWKIQFDGWTKFKTDSLKNIGMFNTKAIMEQTDRWSAQLTDWNKQFAKEAPGQTVGPVPTQPGQGIPLSSTQNTIIGTALILTGIIGGAFAIGYLINSIKR